MSDSAIRNARARLVAAAICAASMGCKPICDVPESCDIRDAACQQTVMRATACVRGDSPLKTPVRVVNAAKYTNEQATMAAQADDAQRVADWYHGLSLLGLAPSGWDAAKGERKAVSDLAAFYSEEDKTVTVLDRGDKLDGSQSVLLLVHEFVHALQDAEHDLGKLVATYATTFDSSLALGALTEGEALLRQDQAAAFQIGLELEDVNWPRAFEAFRSASYDDVLHSNARITALRGDFVYAYGAAYVYDAWRDRARQGIEALYEHPPVSSRQVMIGYAHSPPGGAPWVEPELDDVAVPVLGAQFEYVDSAHLGAFTALVYAQMPTFALETGPLRKLRNDVLSVFRATDGSALAVWRLRFVSTSDAASFVDFVSESARAWASERDAFIARSDLEKLNGAQFDPIKLVQAASWGPIPMESTPASGSARIDLRFDAF